MVEDGELRRWEAYPAAGKFGSAENSRIMFYPLSDRTLKARFVEREASETATGSELSALSTEELRTLLESAEEVK